MASYGKIYEFVRDSQNGAEIIITISKKNYNGESMVRPLGRAPLLKRENNGHIFGTSLEIYAECKVDGEFAQFYTSSADEFLVEVWKDQVLIWSGFISPELYSEPDIAPPYDVQIIATDGLGELRNFEFINDGDITISDHLSQLISHTGLSLETIMASDLRYYDGEVASDAVDILDFRVDLSHDDGESCYDVLQNLLSSLNASITQFNGKWFIFRETDFIGLTSADGLKAFAPGGSETFMDIALFGSSKTCQWWPVGQLSSVIEPAKNRLTLISSNNYKNNVLNGSWTSVNGAVYDEAEAAYVLPDEGSYITQKLDFAGNEVGYRLALRVSARNVGSGEEDQALGVRVVIDGRSYAGERQYWLIQPESSDRGIGSYMWKTFEGSVEADLAVPSDSDTSADAQDIDIILPLYRNDNRSYIYAKTVEVTVFNPSGIHDIYVYGVSLSKYDQFEGYQANVVLDNGAREEGSSIDLSLSDGTMTPAADNVFMSGIPLQPDADEAIISWGIGSSDAEDYIGLMSKDYSRQVALPRMSYKGVLNVPRAAIPALFLRDNTYYFPRTYTYDLYNDELEVDLISIPAADLAIDTIQIGQIAQPQGVPSSGGSGGGGGIGGVDLSGYAKKEEVTTLADLLASMWSLDEDGNLVTDRNVIIKNNLTVAGDTSTGGTGSNPAVSGTLIGIKVNGQTYKDPVNGILTIPDYPTSLEWSAINGKPTKLTEFTNDLGLGSLAYKNSLALADVPDLSSKYLSTAGGTISGELKLKDSALRFIDTSNVERIFTPMSWKSNALGWYDGSAWQEVYHTGNFNPANYLPLSGGKLSSEVLTDVLTLNSNVANAGTYLRLEYLGSKVAEFGHGWGLGTYMWCNSHNLRITSDGTAYADSNTLIHSGNIGSQSVASATIARSVYSPSNKEMVVVNDGSAVEVFGSVAYDTYVDGKTLAFRYGSSYATAMTVNSSGNVTVGASDLAGTDADAKLCIDGGIAMKLGSNVASVLRISDDILHLGYTRYASYHTKISGWNILLNPQGSVLIGTTTDSGYKLDVAGTFNSNALRTNSSTKAFWGHADYYGILSWDTTYASVMAKSGLALRLGISATPYITIASSGAISMAGAVTMSSTLSVGGNIGFSKGFAYNLGTNASPASILYTTAIRCAVNGTLSLGNDNGLWAQFASDGTFTIHKPVTMSSALSVTSGVTSTRFLTNGNYGFWRGPHFSASLTDNDVVIYGSNVCMAGVTRPHSDKTTSLGTSSYQWSAVYAVNAIFSGDTTINGNLVVAGDISA